MDYYKQIFKRKSFHLFKDTETITDAEIKGIEELQVFLKNINMPSNLQELGAKEEDINFLAHNACYGNNAKYGTLSGFVTLTEEDVKNIYKQMI